MLLQKELIVIVAVIVVSQWAGQIWIAGNISSRPIDNNSKEMKDALAEVRQQLRRIETLQATRVATVDPNTNTVTMDQSMLQNTLRDIVSSELDKVSPALSAEYTDKVPGMAYVGEQKYMEPEQAFERTQAIIQEAIQYGELDGAHAAAMAPLVNNLSQQQRIQLLEQYHTALNRGEIKMTGIVPPL